MQPARARASGLGVPLLPLARWVGWVAPVCPTHGVLVLSCPSAALRVCGVLGVLRCVGGVLGHLAPVHRLARSVRCFPCAVSWATWLLFTGVPAWFVVLCLRCPGPLGSCSSVRPLGVLCCVWGVLGHLAPVHRCARWVCCVARAVSWASCLLFSGVHARCVVLRVWRPGSLGSCSLVCRRGLLCCICGVLGHLAPVHRCACSVCCVTCAVSWATWLLFTGVPARCVVFRVWCPGPLGSCSPVCPLGVLCCVCGVPGHLAPVHRCARSVRCFGRAVSRATWLLFTGALLGVLCCVCGVLGHLAPVHRSARCVCCVACAVSRATWLLNTGVPARRAAACVRCPGPLGSCSPVCQAVVSRPFVALGACACAVSWPTWRLFTGVRAVCGARVPLVVVSLFLPP